MSKKLVREALGCLDQEPRRAVEMLTAVDAAFVRKRLEYLVRTGEVTAELAHRLWTAAHPSLGPLAVTAEPIQVDDDSSGSEPAPRVAEAATQAARLVPPPASRTIVLERAEEFLDWINAASRGTILMDDFRVAQPWGLVAIAALARTDREPSLHVEINQPTGPGRFAHALGLLDVISGSEPHGTPEPGRTVKLRRIDDFQRIEPAAYEISKLIVGSDRIEEGEAEESYVDAEEVRRTIYYVLVELMRNVMQHSGDGLGGVVAAQSMIKGGSYAENPAIQVAVADAGKGVYAALRAMHSDIATPRAALEHALWPYVSGAFDSTKRGSSQNAGLGLFFVSEMAKLTGGRLLLASHEHALLLEGAAADQSERMHFLPAGYPGTLVVFELPKRGVADYDALIRTITTRAEERASGGVRRRWINHCDPPSDAFECVVAVAGEDTVKAEEFAQGHLIPRLAAKKPVVVNFRNVDICTQSFMHALLFEPLRTAWALRTPIYVVHAQPAVLDGLKLLESYALADVSADANGE